MKSISSCVVRFLPTSLDRTLHRNGNDRSMALIGPMSGEESSVASAAARVVMRCEPPTDYMVSVEQPASFISMTVSLSRAAMNVKVGP